MHKSLLEYIDVVAEETSPTNIILAVAELMRKEADTSGKPAEKRMFVFLDRLKNAGLSIDYPSLKGYFDADPKLKNVIQQFNDREIEFVGQGDEEEMPDAGAPTGEVPPEKKVNQMAKAALSKRESIGEDEYDSDKFFSGKGTPEQRLKLLKLQNKSLRAPPSSPKQQAIKQEINALRKEIGMKVTEDEYAALDSFTNNLNLSPEEDAKIASNQYEDDDELMAKLMDHFSDEMPYGTQKGRDGDPYEFIFQELDSMGLIKEELGEAKSSDDLQQAVNAAIAMFKRSGRGGEQIIPSENFDGFNDDEAMAGIRHWGNWENPQDEEDEEDYDWQDPTDETYEKATKLIAQISKQFPDIKFELGVEEKNTMIVSAKHKVKEDNVAEMTFSQLKGSLKGKVMSDEKLEELKQLIEKHGLAEVSKMFSIDARELQAMTESNFTESINDILHLSGIKK